MDKGQNPIFIRPTPAASAENPKPLLLATDVDLSEITRLVQAIEPVAGNLAVLINGQGLVIVPHKQYADKMIKNVREIIPDITPSIY